jgi:excisionase family DNA binding protein
MTTERAARYLSALDAARYLGVSRRTFYDHVRNDISPIRIGARVLFDEADLDKWAEARKEARTPATPETQTEPATRGQVLGYSRQRKKNK